MELEKRLGLYEVFVKIYEHNRSLLDEILQLENSAPASLSGKAPGYIQGVVQGQQAYIVTNLVNGKSLRLFQPQKIWVMGRDPRLSLAVRDRWMSRRHAAIHYIHNEGFYLIDLNSTNGSFINGEPVVKRHLLQDGDIIRLGSLTISFFIGQTSQTLAPVPSDILAQINSAFPSSTLGKKQEIFTSIIDDEEYRTNGPDDTSMVLNPNQGSGEATSPTSLPQMSASQRSDILDRFLGNRKMPAGQSEGKGVRG